MGLTIHYQIEAAQQIDAAEAQRIVKEGRNIAGRMMLRLAFDAVAPLAWDHRSQKAATCYKTFPVAGRKGSFVEAEVWPLEGFVFRTLVGRDCEPLWLGLCRYPEAVETAAGRRKTRLGGRWCFSGFSKTQYASLHGWAHFLRCHRAIIELLAEWRQLGLSVRIMDEGGYWPRLSERVLRRNLDEMNGAVAAAAGAIKDQCQDTQPEGGVEAPIFRHPQFERLEAEGASRQARRPPAGTGSRIR